MCRFENGLSNFMNDFTRLIWKRKSICGRKNQESGVKSLDFFMFFKVKFNFKADFDTFFLRKNTQSDDL